LDVHKFIDSSTRASFQSKSRSVRDRWPGWSLSWRPGWRNESVCPGIITLRGRG